jgi:hypothetical protein
MRGLVRRPSWCIAGDPLRTAVPPAGGYGPWPLCSPEYAVGWPCITLPGGVWGAAPEECWGRLKRTAPEAGTVTACPLAAVTVADAPALEGG